MKLDEANVSFLDVPPFFYFNHCILSQNQQLVQLPIVIISNILLHQQLYINLHVSQEFHAFVHVLQLKHVGIIEVYND